VEMLRLGLRCLESSELTLAHNLEMKVGSILENFMCFDIHLLFKKVLNKFDMPFEAMYSVSFLSFTAFMPFN